MTDHTIVWQMGRWYVVTCRGGYVIEKRNALGGVVWSSEVYSGWTAKKRAIADARSKYGRDA